MTMVLALIKLIGYLFVNTNKAIYLNLAFTITSLTELMHLQVGKLMDVENLMSVYTRFGSTHIHKKFFIDSVHLINSKITPAKHQTLVKIAIRLTLS